MQKHSLPSLVLRAPSSTTFSPQHLPYFEDFWFYFPEILGNNKLYDPATKDDLLWAEVIAEKE